MLAILGADNLSFAKVKTSEGIKAKVEDCKEKKNPGVFKGVQPGFLCSLSKNRATITCLLMCTLFRSHSRNLFGTAQVQEVS